MHELSLCQSIYSIVDRAAAGRPVDTIHLQVGRLRQVVPDVLAFCWELVSADTALAGSSLDIDVVEVELHCADCGANTILREDPFLVCASCGGSRLSVESGEELDVVSVDLAEV